MVNGEKLFYSKKETAYGIMPRLVGSEMCIRGRSLALDSSAQHDLRVALAVTLFDDDASTSASCFATLNKFACFNLLVQSDDCMQQRLRTRRAPRCVDVDGHDLIDTLNQCIIVEHAAA